MKSAKEPDACPGEIVILADDTLKLNDIVGNEKLLPHKTRIDNPMPLLRTTVEPQKPEQREALLNALAEIADTDPLLHFDIDTVTHEIILSFLGKLQLEVICSLLEEKYHVSVDMKEPSIIYMERPQRKASHTIHIEVPPNPFCFITLTEKYMTPHSYYGIAIEGQPEEQIYYHRSIQDIFNLCFRAGFVIDGFYEECFKNNKEIPMVMIVRLKKNIKFGGIKIMANEVAKVEEKAVAEYGAGVNLGDFFADELDGLTPSFERIKIPAGGGLAFEVPGNDPESPDSVKEFKAVILYHHPINCYYKEEYTGGNNPPDCGSMDGHVGIEAETGEVKNCAECEFSKFGTGKNGAKACKQKRRIYLLREGEALPIILSLPTGSLGELSKYIVRVRAKYAGTYCVVTKFTFGIS